MTTVHIMIDLETWGTTPGSDIRSIGACVFNPLTGGVGQHEADGRQWPVQANRTFYIACDNPFRKVYDGEDQQVKLDLNRRYPLTRDPQTVQWWSEQSDEAKAAFANPVDLKDALEAFGWWLCKFYPDGVFQRDRDTNTICLWSHGPSFDPPILAAAYKAVGLPVPWHYRAPRDTRTAFDMAGIEDHSAWLDSYKTGTHHHALDDAICQAKAVCGAYSVLRDEPTGLPLSQSYKRAKQAVENYYDATDMNYTMGEACDAGSEFIMAADDLMRRANKAFMAITDAAPK